MTGTPILVNTPKWSVISRASLIYMGCSKFKQTFVLDAKSGVDIMRRLEIKAGRSLSSPLFGGENHRCDTQPPIRKKPLSLE
ncbi:hypothetical protein EMIT051CA3_11162 [Pseudomonas chlororaphis]